MKLVIALLVMTSTSLLAAEKVMNEGASLSPTEKVTLRHPEHFHYDITKDPDDMFREALRLRSFDTAGISALSFKLFWRKEEKQFADQKMIDAGVQKISASYVEGSVEKASVVRHLHITEGIGAYCVLTDADLARVAKPAPGEYRYLTFGLVKINGYVFTVRGYSNAKDDGDYKAMLTILEGLKIEKVMEPKRENKDTHAAVHPRNLLN
jgi:hypothetical protein